MPRSLVKPLNDAMDAGVYTPYLRVYTGDSFPTYEHIPVRFYLGPTTATVTFLDNLDRGYYARFFLERGVIVNGTVYSIKSSVFYAHQVVIEKELVTLYGELLPMTKLSLAPNLTYAQVLAYVDDYMPNGLIGYESDYTWKTYQFYPTGRSIVFSQMNHCWNIFRSKYAIFFTEKGWDGANSNVFCYCAGENRYSPYTSDWTLTDPLFKRSWKTIYKRYLWRDDAGTIHYSGYSDSPVYNLGYLPNSASAPTLTSSPDEDSKSIVPVHLERLSGDVAYINSGDDNNNYYGRVIVEEIFDPKKVPSWHQVISSHGFLNDTEGGSLPSTIEAAAPYTPLNVSMFSEMLSASDNNIQAAFDTLDDHTHTSAATVAAELPASGEDGQMVYCTGDSTLYIWVTDAWVGITGVPPTDYYILLEDGASFLLLEDAASKIIMD